MHLKYYLNREWRFTDSFEGSLLIEPMKKGELVNLPHTISTTGYNYIDFQSQRAQCVYQKQFFAKEEWRGKRIILNFDGIAHKAGIYINGVNLCIHECGYTPFHVDIDSKVSFGETNLITILVDSRNNLNQPPFVEGSTPDITPFGGIYREVSMVVKDRISMEHVFYQADTTLPPNTKGMSREGLAKYTVPGKIHTSITLSAAALSVAEEHRLFVRQYLNGREISYQPLDDTGETDTVTGPVNIWDIDSPTCYSVQTDLIFDDVVIDTYVSNVGFRSIAFDQSGFHLNGRRVKLRGIVRHQSFPYVGYAMPESMQRFDAKILKEELHVNAVRCYGGFPSPHFIEECDSRGILVFCEAPGYRSIGDASFKQVHINNVKEMIIEGRNHPCIFLWGVRINGSISTQLDEDAVEIAHKLDPTRYTSGERLETDMDFAEDVYAYTDMSFSGRGDPLMPKEEVTSDMERPYIISGYLGESLPVKPSDSYKRKAKQIMYAASILDAQAFRDDIAGSFAYCMSDHVSTSECAAEDGIVYQGIMDCFRNKKPVASIYSSQNNTKPEIMVYPPITGDRERWEGFGDIYIITNTKKIRVYRDEVLIHEYDSKDSIFPHMRHGPILMNDFIGELEDSDGDVKSEQTKRIKKLLNQMSLGGLSSFLQPGQMMDRLISKIIYRMNRRQLLDLYEKYASKNHVYKFEGINDNKAEVTAVMSTGEKRFLKADISSLNLIERRGYDVVSVRIRVNDENGMILNDYAEPITIEKEGPIEIIGPQIIPLRGGFAGTYVKSIGKEGTGKLILKSGNMVPVELEFNILKTPEEIL